MLTLPFLFSIALFQLSNIFGVFGMFAHNVVFHSFRHHRAVTNNGLIGSFSLSTFREAKRKRHLCSTSNNNLNESAVNGNEVKVFDLKVDCIKKELLSVGFSRETYERLYNVTDPYHIQEFGFDSYFGKSAIKTLRTFLYSSKESVISDIAVAAKRTAIQIDFLARRHRSREAEYIRCVDDEQKQRQMFPIALVLDNLRSAANVGSIFRTADAAGCAEVITVGYTPRPNGSGAEKLAKSALGAELVVPTQHFTNINEALTYLRTSGYEMVVGEFLMDYRSISKSFQTQHFQT